MAIVNYVINSTIVISAPDTERDGEIVRKMSMMGTIFNLIRRDNWQLFAFSISCKLLQNL